MFRPIRRKEKEIELEAAKEILKNAKRGVLAVNGDDGYPYAVPINYFYDEENEKLYFHGSYAGHKADSIKASDKICFTAYGNEEIRNEAWAPFVKSVVVFGRCHIIDDREKSLELVKRFALKYYPNSELVESEISVSGKAVKMFEISIEHISGKEIQEK